MALATVEPGEKYFSSQHKHILPTSITSLRIFGITIYQYFQNSPKCNVICDRFWVLTKLNSLYSVLYVLLIQKTSVTCQSCLLRVPKKPLKHLQEKVSMPREIKYKFILGEKKNKNQKANKSLQATCNTSVSFI